jgi:hypothetical protein
MKTQLTWGWARTTVAAAVCGVATIAVAACSPSATASATVSATTASATTAQQPAAAVPAANVPVLVDCAVHGQVRPGQYILACGDGGGYLSGLHWAAWGASAAFADGTSTINNGDSFPVLVDLWRAEPRPGHAGQRYFTRLTLVFTGNRSYTEGGAVHEFPATLTYPLSSFGGA